MLRERGQEREVRMSFVCCLLDAPVMDKCQVHLMDVPRSFIVLPH